MTAWSRSVTHVSPTLTCPSHHVSAFLSSAGGAASSSLGLYDGLDSGWLGQVLPNHAQASSYLQSLLYVQLFTHQTWFASEGNVFFSNNTFAGNIFTFVFILRFVDLQGVGIDSLPSAQLVQLV